MSIVVNVQENGVFQLVKTNDKTGKVADTENIQADKALAPKAVGNIISQAVKTHGALRLGWLSFLSLVLAQTRLDNMKGQGDRTTGTVSKEFKAAVRDAEGLTVQQLVESGDLKLPVVKGDNDELRLQRFLSTLRDDKNYSNAKVTAIKYFALVGKNVVTESGYIVPVPVMQAAIAEVVDKPAKVDSVSAKLIAIEAFMSEHTISADDAVDSLAAVNRLMATLVGINKHYAEMATAVRSNPDLPHNATESAAQAAIATAQESALTIEG